MESQGLPVSQAGLYDDNDFLARLATHLQLDSSNNMAAGPGEYSATMTRFTGPTIRLFGFALPSHALAAAIFYRRINVSRQTVGRRP